jgi:uncharacterized protein YbjQ (UPF0145 family)
LCDRGLTYLVRRGYARTAARIPVVATGRHKTEALAHAHELGANAVIGVRYDATEVMSGVTEVLCYGTAVVVVPGHAA